MKFRNVVHTRFPVLTMLALILTTSTASAKGPPQNSCPEAAKISSPIVQSHMLSRCLENGGISDTERAQLFKHRGKAYLELKRYDQALTDFNSAIKFMPDDAEIYNSLGIVNKRLGNYDQAKTNYSRAQKLRPAIVTPNITRQPQPIIDITAIPNILPVKIEAITSKRVFGIQEPVKAILIVPPPTISEEMEYSLIDKQIEKDIAAQ